MEQRLRITFSRGGAIKYLSHLELMRMWERALRRADWKLAYSHGFNPHLKMSFAVPLPVGVSGREELLDVHLEEQRPPAEALEQLSRQMPPGAEVLAVEDVPLDAPPLQRLLMAAEYLAVCAGSPPPEEMAQRVERLIGAESLPRVREKEGKARPYDLRPLIRGATVELTGHRWSAVRMELRTDIQGAGRPDEVLRELGLDPADCDITRLRLILSESGAPTG